MKLTIVPTTNHPPQNMNLLELLFIAVKHLVDIILVTSFIGKAIVFGQSNSTELTLIYRDPNTNKEQWYKFDDGEVSECKMHEDEEMKAQCFGGDYMGEVYDNNLKRMQYRRQKRWWNAYMLFYTRCDHKPIPLKPCVEQLSMAESRNFVLPMPKPIERSVR